MNNDEAMALLVATRNAANAAINGLNDYRREAVAEDNWKAAVKTRKMAEVKQFANDAGADISTWDGTDAP